MANVRQIRSGLARWSLGIASTVTAFIAVAATIFAIAYSRNGEAGISDNWVGVLAAVGILGGLAGSFIAFVLAMEARAKHAHFTWLWFPYLLFPVLLISIILGELLWWE